mmetsp:Transcript_683/g.1188  ORF Transcript_683/g.1188 Transcript_683/m.1188 type:complete len:412 (-) Transcript_683:1742-2977(-)
MATILPPILLLLTAPLLIEFTWTVVAFALALRTAALEVAPLLSPTTLLLLLLLTAVAVLLGAVFRVYLRRSLPLCVYLSAPRPMGSADSPLIPNTIPATNPSPPLLPPLPLVAWGPTDVLAPEPAPTAIVVVLVASAGWVAPAAVNPSRSRFRFSRSSINGRKVFSQIRVRFFCSSSDKMYRSSSPPSIASASISPFPPPVSISTSIIAVVVVVIATVWFEFGTSVAILVVCAVFEPAAPPVWGTVVPFVCTESTILRSFKRRFPLAAVPQPPIMPSPLVAPPLLLRPLLRPLPLLLSPTTLAASDWSFSKRSPEHLPASTASMQSCVMSSYTCSYNAFRAACFSMYLDVTFFFNFCFCWSFVFVFLPEFTRLLLDPAPLIPFTSAEDCPSKSISSSSSSSSALSTLLLPL